MAKTTVKKTSHKGLKITVSLIVLAVAVAGGIYAYQSGMYKKSAAERTQANAPVVATIGQEKVTLADLETFKKESPQLADIPMEMIYHQLLDLYLNQKILLAQAEKMNLKEDAQVKKLLADAERQLLMQAYLAKQIEARMTPERLKLLYDAEVKNFVPAQERHARHILVNSEKEAKDIIVQLNAGANFAALAEKYSVDENSGARGGDLGYFRKEMMIPEFGNAAFELEKGAYSRQPVKTPFGWHVIYVEDVRETTPPAFEEVQEGLQRKFAELMAPEVLKEEKALAKVKTFDIYGNSAAVQEEQDESLSDCDGVILDEPTEE